MTQLYDAGVGDVIEIPGHWPGTVTVTGWENADTPTSCIWSDMAGSLCRVSWTAPGARGTTTMSDAALISVVEQVGPDHPLRRQYEADLEAALARLAATVGEG